MKKQGFLLLLIVFLGGVWLFVSNSQNPVEKPILEKMVSVKKITQVEIHNFTNKYEFEKRADGFWWIKKNKTELGEKVSQTEETHEFQKADTIQVTRLLTRLELLRLTNPISTEKTKANQFQINDHSPKVVLKDSSGQVLDQIFVGKPGPVLNSTYIKRGQSDSVYLVDENLYEALPLKYSEWLQNSKEGL